MVDVPTLPDSLVLQIFFHLPYSSVLRAGLTCHQWFAISRDELLWRELFYDYYRIPRNVPRHPAAMSWYTEFQRLYDWIPCVEVQTLKEHQDQVLHLAFSQKGHLFSSCSKDCTVKLWDTERLDGTIALLHSSSMRQFNWGYTQFSQFNCDDTLLLVSGVHLGPHHSSSGEIAVISLENYTLLSRVRNKPYDIFGCWLNETHLISGNLHWIGNMTSCSVLWLNKAFQDVESENVNVVKRLFKIQNINASTIRTLMVAHCRRHDTPDLLLDHEVQSQQACSRAMNDQDNLHEPLFFDLGTSYSDEEEADIVEKRKQQDQTVVFTGYFNHLKRTALEHVFQERHTGLPEDRALETQVAKLMGRAHTKVSDPVIVSNSSMEAAEKTYLIFTTGSLTYSPHQIGIKRITPDQMTTCGPVLGVERSTDEFFDMPDHVIDIHGHIIGMGLSPDHRYLYVNSRAWPAGYMISDPMSPPPIAEDIDMHVIDLKSLREERRSLRAHRAFTPNDECFFIFLDVSRDFVASGAEDKHGYIWDRHYNICLAKLQHTAVVNSVAFNPADQELLLSASDDSTIKVWRSARMVRLAQTKSRATRPRNLLVSLLNHHKCNNI